MPMGTFMRKNLVRGGLASALLVGLAASAAAQDISENTVKAFMNYAWSMTPAKFTKPDGKVVEIDKKEREKVEVAVDVAREIIRAGRMTAHAQLCDLGELQVLNYRSLMKRESEKKKWTEQQMIYINQLHLTTVMLLTGKIKEIVEGDGGEKRPVVEDTRAADAKSCSDEQRKKVSDLITAYLKTGPAVTLDSAPPATASAPPVAATPPAPAAPPAAPTPAAAPAPKKP
jgi:hypothetical protein